MTTRFSRRRLQPASVSPKSMFTTTPVTCKELFHGFSDGESPVYNRESMHPARIAELLAPFLTNPATSPKGCHSEERRDEEPAVLSVSQLQAISTYIDILLRWNARINLTSIRDPEEIVTRHFGESLFVARHLLPRHAFLVRADTGPPEQHVPASSSTDTPISSSDSRGRAALQGRDAGASRGGTLAPASVIRLTDLGSGAGFPGIPIKLWAPQIFLTLIESSHKKSTFLREVVRALTLTDIDVLNARAESLADSLFEVVTLRAVEHFNAILPIAVRLLAPGGRLALLIGLSQVAGVRLALPDLSWSSVLPVPLSNSRALLIGHSRPGLHESKQ